MNTIYKSILILGLGLVSVTAFAQKKDKEDDLTRQVILERDYNPTLNEATKINTAPNIFTPNVKSASSVKFLDQAPQLTIGATKLGQVASGDIRTDVPFNKEKFYLNLGAGSYGNMDGAIGVRAVDTDNDKLDIAARYLGMDGNIDYAHTKNLLKKSKAKSSDLGIGVKFEHKFDPSVFTIAGGYQNMGYNYYGNPFFLKEGAKVEHFDLTTKQKVDLINFSLGLKSSEKNEGKLKYDAQVAYTNFSAKYGYLPIVDKGPRGGIIDADVNLYTKLGEGNIGLVASALNQWFTSRDEYSAFASDIAFHGYTNLGVNPYYKLEDKGWNVTVGANVNYVFDASDKFVFAPNIFGQVHINDVNTLYAGVTGGVNDNTFTDILQENKYVNMASRVAYSRTPFDIKVGFKSGVIPNFEFDIFGGYKQTKDDHLYASLTAFDISGDTRTWGNVAAPIYDKVSTGHAGGMVSTKLIPLTTLSAKVVGYFYKTDTAQEAYGKPKFTAEIAADIQPIENLTLSLSYLMMTGRKGHNWTVGLDELYGLNIPANVESSAFDTNMKDINEFNVRAEYQIIKQLSVHARVNNIFNQKYEQQLGYTLQGMNVLGGFNVKF